MRTTRVVPKVLLMTRPGIFDPCLKARERALVEVLFHKRLFGV